MPDLTHAIAEILDHPSVFMGGPSRQSVRKAEAIVKMLAKAREDAIREAADIVNKNRDISGWVSHDAILALLNDGGRDE